METVALSAIENEQQNFDSWLRHQNPGWTIASCAALIDLYNQGYPIPYIINYEKEKVHDLTEERAYAIIDAYETWQELNKHKHLIEKEIQAQNQFSDEYRHLITRAYEQSQLDDIALPFKHKKTLATLARAAGLDTLANELWEIAHTSIDQLTEEPDFLQQKAGAYIKADSKYNDADAVLKDVQEILIEKIAETPYLRSLVRGTLFRKAKIFAQKGPKAKPNSRYSKYFGYKEPIGSLKKSSASYRYFMMRKGKLDDELTLSVERADEGILIEKFEQYATVRPETPVGQLLAKAARSALQVNVFTAMENEVHRYLKEHAEKHIIELMAAGLKKRLLASPFGEKPVMGIDPGNDKTHASMALVLEDGKYFTHTNFNLKTGSDSEETHKEILQTIQKLQLAGIAIAYSTKGKELRKLIQKILHDGNLQIPVTMIYSSDAAIYSTGPTAKEEFPELDAGVRKAIFIARTFQNPLQEIVKLDTKFMDLGPFQHDVNQNRMRKVFHKTIEAVVAQVGININTASHYLLTYAPGLNQELAKAIVKYRETNGNFAEKENLKKVPGLTEKQFKIAAGFLRIRDAKNFLDSTAIHPEFYPLLEDYARRTDSSLANLSQEQLDKMKADEILIKGLGANTLSAIIQQIQTNTKDIRGSFELFQYHPEAQSLESLKTDIEYPGIITSITHFGVFVDIGLEQDGLVHISEFTDHSKYFYDELAPGDKIFVWFQKADLEKKQISFALRSLQAKQEAEQKKRESRNFSRRRPYRSNRERPAQAGDQQATTQSADNPNWQPTDDRRPQQRRRDFQRRQPRAEQGPEGKQDRRPPREKKKQKITRDPTTGAVVKNDQDDYSSRKMGIRIPTKAEPTKFNPFANLDSLLKTKNKE